MPAVSIDNLSFSGLAHMNCYQASTQASMWHARPITSTF